VRRPTVLPSPRGEHEAQASLPFGITRRHGFSWSRARVSRNRSDASRSLRSEVARQAEYARPSSKELHGNTSDGGHEARAGETVQGVITAVPKMARYARSARASSRVTRRASVPLLIRGYGVDGLETNGVRARRS